MVGQVVKATLDEAHPDLPVGEPADERAQQLLGFVDQTLGQMDLKDTDQKSDGASRVQGLAQGHLSGGVNEGGARAAFSHSPPRSIRSPARFSNLILVGAFISFF